MDECTCGKKIGVCEAHKADGQALVTWRDQSGDFHVNGTGVVIRDMRPDLTGAPEWVSRVRARGEVTD